MVKIIVNFLLLVGLSTFATNVLSADPNSKLCKKFKKEKNPAYNTVCKKKNPAPKKTYTKAGSKLTSNDKACIRYLSTSVPKMVYKRYKCKSKSYYEKLIASDQKNSVLPGNANKYTTRRELCEKRYKGRFMNNGSCMSQLNKYEQFEKEVVAVADREYKNLHNRWKGRSLNQVCKEDYKTKKHGDYGCWFSQRHKDDVAISFYFQERWTRDKKQKADELKTVTKLYAKLDQKARDKRLKEKTKLVFYPQLNKSWKETREICRKDGLELPASSDFVKNRDEVISYIHAIINKKDGYSIVARVSDELDTQMFMNEKGKAIVRNGDNWGGKNPVICKKLNDSEKMALAKKEAEEKILIDKFTVTTPLAFWQRLVELSDPNDLKMLSKYSGRKVQLSLGDGWVEFKKAGGGWVLTDSLFEYYRQRRERSSNIFKWAFKADSGARSAYTKRLSGKTISSRQGLTAQGFKHFQEDLIKQPLFKVLTNRGTTDKKYRVVIYGSFKDKKGVNHTVNIECNPSYIKIWVN